MLENDLERLEKKTKTNKTQQTDHNSAVYFFGHLVKDF